MVSLFGKLLCQAGVVFVSLVFICLIKSAFIYREEKSQLSALETNLLFIMCQNTPTEPPNQLPLGACQKLVFSNF